jgi:hypothetical protein
VRFVETEMQPQDAEARARACRARIVTVRRRAMAFCASISEVDDQLKGGWLLGRQIGRIYPLAVVATGVPL